jgi:hypothetical protein
MIVTKKCLITPIITPLGIVCLIGWRNFILILRFFIWYFWSIWYPMPGGFHTNSCLFLGFNDCDACCIRPGSDCGYLGGGTEFGGNCGSCSFGSCGNMGEGAIVILVILLLIVAIVGFLLAMIVFVILIASIVQKRLHYLKKKTALNTERVVDLGSK